MNWSEREALSKFKWRQAREIAFEQVEVDLLVTR